MMRSLTNYRGYSINLFMSSSSNKQKKNPPKGPNKADECMCALMSTARMIGRYAGSKFAEHQQFSKLSGPRVGVLFIVQATGAIRMGDLAAKLMVAPRTVTDFVDGLERDGFLRRIPDPSDRRAMLIELTPAVKADFNKISGIRKQFIEEIYSVLSRDEQDRLIGLLRKLQGGPLSKFVQASDL